MDFFRGIFPFLLAGSAFAFIIIKRKKAQEKKYTPDDVIPVVSKTIFIDLPRDKVREKILGLLELHHISLHSENDEKILLENKKIGLFHWGFLYTVNLYEANGGTNVSFGIFGKGPNPPRAKTQEGYLNEFINKIRNDLVS
jgi:hypothetical protein